MIANGDAVSVHERGAFQRAAKSSADRGRGNSCGTALQPGAHVASDPTRTWSASGSMRCRAALRTETAPVCGAAVLVAVCGHGGTCWTETMGYQTPSRWLRTCPAHTAAKRSWHADSRLLQLTSPPGCVSQRYTGNCACAVVADAFREAGSPAKQKASELGDQKELACAAQSLGL